MEGPEVPSKAREARSAEGSVGRGAVAPLQYGGLARLETMAPEKNSTNQR